MSFKSYIDYNLCCPQTLSVELCTCAIKELEFIAENNEVSVKTLLMEFIESTYRKLADAKY